jgi:hypothetical protein
MRAASSLIILFATSILAPGLFAQSPALTSTPAGQSAPANNNSGLLRQDLVPQRPGSQEGCPVIFTAVRLDRPAEFLPAASVSETTPKTHLHLSYSNPGGKEIASVELTGHLKVKRNRYTLDATEVSMPLSFTPSTGELSTEANIPLLKNIVGLERITLNSVIYKDGSVWHAEQEHRTCGYAAQGSLRVAK